MQKKNNIVAGIHNATPEYAKKMINIGFQLVTVGSDKIFMSDGAWCKVKSENFKGWIKINNIWGSTN